MNKIIEYTIVSGTGEEIGKSVNDFIQEGWQPLGGLAMVHLNLEVQTSEYTDKLLGFEYAQAMVKYGDVISL